MNILDMIGGTPLLELSNIGAIAPGIKILAKAEFVNPSGSVKDRAAKAMILDGIERGALTRDKMLVDATSGNTGISYSMLGASLGYKVQLYMPSNTSFERKAIIRRLGASIVETDPLSGSDGAFIAAKEAVERNPEAYFYPDQYNNPANARAHYEGTGKEIWEQTGGRITHFLSVTGTSGSFSGTAARLKEENPHVTTIAVQPSSPLHGIEGAKHLASTIKPGILNEAAIDRIISIETETAYATARQLALKEGLFVGVSSGANVAAALECAKTAPEGSVLVTILCDSGSRYMSDSFWETRFEGGTGI